jgi:hypothetical protein
MANIIESAANVVLLPLEEYYRHSPTPNKSHRHHRHNRHNRNNRHNRQSSSSLPQRKRAAAESHRNAKVFQTAKSSLSNFAKAMTYVAPGTSSISATRPKTLIPSLISLIL